MFSFERFVNKVKVRGRKTPSSILEGAIYLREVIVYDAKIDFDRFSIADINILNNQLRGMLHFEDLDSFEDEEGNSFENHYDPSNTFDVTRKMEDIISLFVKNSFKRYVNNDDFI